MVIFLHLDKENLNHSDRALALGIEPDFYEIGPACFEGGERLHHFEARVGMIVAQLGLVDGGRGITNVLNLYEAVGCLPHDDGPKINAPGHSQVGLLG